MVYLNVIANSIMRMKGHLMIENQPITSYIKHLAVSGLSSVSARIKSTCNLTGKCFEMPNVSYT